MTLHVIDILRRHCRTIRDSLVAGDGLGAVLRGQLPDLQVRVLAAAHQPGSTAPGTPLPSPGIPRARSLPAGLGHTIHSGTERLRSPLMTDLYASQRQSALGSE